MSAGLITIIGGSGFIGRHLVGRLASRGYRVRIAVRDTEKAAQLMTQGNVGQVVGMQTNIRNQASVERAVAGADIVINLVGLLFESGSQKFNAVHVEGAKRVAEAAKAAGARQLIHMSALGADEKSESNYARTKAEGEKAVSEAFEGATILRPSVVFGAGDDFTNKFARLTACLPALPLANGGRALMQPVWIEDLADAIVKIIETPEQQGKIFEFGGPEQVSLRAIIESILTETRRCCPILSVPAGLMKVQALFLSLLPGTPMLTIDQVRLLEEDNVISGTAAGFADLGIAPTAMGSVIPSYVRRFRRGGGLKELHG